MNDQPWTPVVDVKPDRKMTMIRSALAMVPSQCRLSLYYRLIRTKPKRYRYSSSSTAPRRTAGQEDHNADVDPIFQMAASNLRFGPGATSEVGQDLTESFRCQKALVFTDANVRALECFDRLTESLDRNKIDYCIFDRVRVEPNDQSFLEAIAFAKATPYDAVVAMGGGSVLDTAKAANLYASYPQSDFWDHVNAPIGKGLPVPGVVKPLIALPTTSGTGSETTGVAIFDTNKSKTGIADRHLIPALGIVDPNNVLDQPASVTLYTGLDVLCHALESYTAVSSTKRTPRPTSPLHRPAYQGSNPISDVWSLFAIQTTAEHLKAASEGNVESLYQMMLAASAAGMGFGNAGVHLCHGMSYAVSAQVKATVPALYPQVTDHPLIPHGLSVAVLAPTVFDFTHPTNAKRHDSCAFVMGYEDLTLSEAVKTFCEDHLGVETGLAQFGYTKHDVPQLVAATLPQHRVLRLSPRHVGKHELEQLFTAAMKTYTD